MTRLRRRIRAAARLAEFSRHGSAGEFNYELHEQRLLDYVAELQRCRYRHREACRRGWTCASLAVTREFRFEADAFERYFQSARDELRASPAKQFGLKHWLEELDELEAEFGGWELDRYGELSVVTGTVTLQDETLGRFRLALGPSALARNSGPDGFSIVALDPNPASGNASVTHPHVRDERLCAGDAHDAIEQALSDGRLADSFVLVRSVLLTYNPHSPYVALEDWNGPDCDDCGFSVSEDAAGGCDSCGCVLCEECQWYCAHCSAARCGGCADSCAVCSDRFCQRCLGASAISDRDCCPECRRRCAGCARVVAEDEFNASEGRCEECVPASALPTEPESLPQPASDDTAILEIPGELSHSPTQQPTLAAAEPAAEV